MKITSLGANQTLLKLNGDIEVLFSYNTPVAGHISGVGYIKTEKKWSKTTSSHINKYLDGCSAEVKPQSFFDDLVK